MITGLSSNMREAEVPVQKYLHSQKYWVSRNHSSSKCNLSVIHALSLWMGLNGSPSPQKQTRNTLDLEDIYLTADAQIQQWATAV